MKIDEKRFPILGCLNGNKLTDKIYHMLGNSGFDNDGCVGIEKSFDYFLNQKLQINYVSSTIHEKLSESKNFIKAKSLLKNTKEVTGLLLLPQTILPDFSKVPSYVNVNPKDYPINAILYSWLSMDNHDKISGDFEEESPWGADEDRELLIIPIHDNRITQATDQLYMHSNDEIYGIKFTENEGAWYGKIHDYIMSFILFYNFTESETHVIHSIESGLSRRIKLEDDKYVNETNNNIEIIDVNYFTKLIRVGEFGVSGHFRVQHYGVGNTESKIVFIEDYKKAGYIKGARIEKNNGC